MRRTSSFVHSIPATLLLAIAACGGDDGGTEPATFLTSTEAQRVRALSAASGGDAGLAYFMGMFAVSAPPESQCPRIERAGDTVTATFDCADGDGQRVDGRIVATNVASIFDENPTTDPTRDAVVRFEGFHQHAPVAAESVMLDGTVILKPDGALAVELDATLAGIAVLTDAVLVADGEMASVREGGAIEVDGLGRATIHGRWSMDSEAPAGALELHGTDVLRADFSQAFGGCVPISIDGQDAGQLCQDAAPE
jgi:hypothetical protein